MDFDVELVQKARTGDSDAFGKLYEMIYKDLYKTAYYILSNSDDAEDVVAETFYQAWRSIGKLRDETAFRAWIFRILWVYCKKKKADYVVKKNTVELDEAANTVGSKEELSEMLERLLIQDAMNVLNTKERAVIILHSYLSYNGAEIAEILGCPHGTVNSRISRAHKKLRDLLGGTQK